MANSLLERMSKEIETWSGTCMLTLTVDPFLYGPDSPEAASRLYEDVAGRSLISRLVRDLRREGHLKSDRWFAVVEFHQSGYPHWHVLVEAHTIPFSALVEMWGRYRPKDSGRWVGLDAEWQGSRKDVRRRRADWSPRSLVGVPPEFGSVRITWDTGEREKAAWYACKYLCKPPKHGWPKWVLDSPRRIRRYSTSRGLLLQEDPTAEDEIVDGDSQRVAIAVDDQSADQKPTKKRDKTRTVLERIERCGRDAVLVEDVVVMDAKGEIHFSQTNYVGSLGNWNEFALEFGFDPKAKTVEVPPAVRQFCEDYLFERRAPERWKRANVATPIVCAEWERGLYIYGELF